MQGGNSLFGRERPPRVTALGQRTSGEGMLEGGWTPPPRWLLRPDYADRTPHGLDDTP